jgi:hypothetical protein
LFVYLTIMGFQMTFGHGLLINTECVHQSCLWCLFLTINGGVYDG